MQVTANCHAGLYWAPSAIRPDRNLHCVDAFSSTAPPAVSAGPYLRTAWPKARQVGAVIVCARPRPCCDRSWPLPRGHIIADRVSLRCVHTLVSIRWCPYAGVLTLHDVRPAAAAAALRWPLARAPGRASPASLFVCVVALRRRPQRHCRRRSRTVRTARIASRACGYRTVASTTQGVHLVIGREDREAACDFGRCCV